MGERRLQENLLKFGTRRLGPGTTGNPLPAPPPDSQPANPKRGQKNFLICVRPWAPLKTIGGGLPYIPNNFYKDPLDGAIKRPFSM